jgi:hypothetical protein
MANAVALLVYAVGLLAPLTPSTGRPTMTELLVFAGLPAGLLFFSSRRVEKLWMQVLLILQAIGIVVLTILMTR